MNIEKLHRATSELLGTLSKHADVSTREGHLAPLHVIMPELAPIPNTVWWEKIFWGYGSRPLTHYHTLGHIAMMLNAAKVFAPPVLDPFRYRGLLLSIIYHDVVYEVGAPPGENEQLSADMAVAHLDAARVSNDLVEMVYGVIMATATHTLKEVSVRHHDVAKAIIDLDLMNLGADTSRFVTDGERIWEEHRHRFSRAEFDAGRQKWARDFLISHPTIYHTPKFQLLEQKARSNLATLAGMVAA